MKSKPSNAWPAVLIVAGIVLFVASGILLLSGFKGDLISVTGPARPGAPLGNFSLSDLNGAQISLADFRGRPVLINTWATWCPPCRSEMPTLNAYYQSQQSKGLVILAINAGETRQEAAAFASEYGLRFQVLLDPAERLMDQLQIFDFPTSILVGRDGLVKAVHIGMLTPEIIAKEITPFLTE
jgi:peroxiredoxin